MKISWKVAYLEAAFLGVEGDAHTDEEDDYQRDGDIHAHLQACIVDRKISLKQ